MRLAWLACLFIIVRLSAQESKLYSEIHWRPDQSYYTTETQVQKIVGDSLGNTYVLYWSDKDFRVKNSEFLCMKRITTIGSHSVIMKLDPSGNFVWGMGLNGGYYSDIACDKKGNLLVSAIGGRIPGHYLLAYLPNCSVMAEGACRMIMKINPAGQLLWQKKEVGDLSDGSVGKIWLDDAGNVYQYILLIRADQNVMEKYSPAGTRLWSVSLDHSICTAVNVNRAGETYYACKTLKMKNGKEVYPQTGDKNEVWKLNSSGVKSVVMSRDWIKPHKVDEWNYIAGDYFINHIDFNSDNTPVFWSALLMQYQCEYVVIAGKKFMEKDGSFVFAEIGNDGNVLTSLQLKAGSGIFERDVREYHEIGVSNRLGGVYCGKRKWLFGAPVTQQHSEANPAPIDRELSLAYVTYDANLDAFTWQESESKYGSNYKGVGFGYMGDSTLLTWGRRHDDAIPAKPNYTFSWFYIERAKPGKPTKENPEQVIAAEPETPIAIDTAEVVSNSSEPGMISDSVKAIYSALLYPNPTNANSIFQFVMPENTVENTEASFFVIDPTGNIIESRVITVHAGENKEEVLSSNYAMGTYTVKVVCKEMEFAMQLIRI